MPDALEGEEEANEVSDDEQNEGSDFGIDDESGEDSGGDDEGSFEEEELEELEMFGEEGDALLTSYD
jgi:hypothetical protein